MPPAARLRRMEKGIPMVDRRANDTGISRRDAIRVVGATTLGVIANGLSATLVAQGRGIIRTVLEDIPPARLTGITLFHEHLSMGRSDGQPIFYDDTGLVADEV